MNEYKLKIKAVNRRANMYVFITVALILAGCISLHLIMMSIIGA